MEGKGYGMSQSSRMPKIKRRGQNSIQTSETRNALLELPKTSQTINDSLQKGYDVVCSDAERWSKAALPLVILAVISILCFVAACIVDILINKATIENVWAKGIPGVVANIIVVAITHLVFSQKKSAMENLIKQSARLESQKKDSTLQRCDDLIKIVRKSDLSKEVQDDIISDTLKAYVKRET